MDGLPASGDPTVSGRCSFCPFCPFCAFGASQAVAPAASAKTARTTKTARHVDGKIASAMICRDLP
jgi:hypothetical protein